MKSTFTTRHLKLRVAARAAESGHRLQVEAVVAWIGAAQVERETID